jgi:hypothetical protein
MIASGSRTMIAGSLSSCIAGSFYPAGSYDHPARDTRALAQGRLRSSWRWKSRPLGGRPQIDTELRALIRRMSMENPLWGAPRIHGELLKLGLRSRSRALPSTWPNGAGRRARDGGPSCETTRRTLPPWTFKDILGAPCRGAGFYRRLLKPASASRQPTSRTSARRQSDFKPPTFLRRLRGLRPRVRRQVRSRFCPGRAARFRWCRDPADRDRWEVRPGSPGSCLLEKP